MMVQPVSDRHAFDLPNGLDLPRYRGIFIQSEMSPLIVVIVNVVFQKSSQVFLVHDDQVIKAFSTKTPDHPLRESVLPR